jgi:transposase-like protein
MVVQCPKCSSVGRTKAGFNAEKIQRFKCKKCGCHYTRPDKKGYSITLKKQAIQLYLAGLSFRAIGRILNISNVTVLNWLRNLKESLQEFRHLQAQKIKVVRMDEMFKCAQCKNKMTDVNLFMRVVYEKESSDEWCWIIVTQKLPKI